MKNNKSWCLETNSIKLTRHNELNTVLCRYKWIAVDKIFVISLQEDLFLILVFFYNSAVNAIFICCLGDVIVNVENRPFLLNILVILCIFWLRYDESLSVDQVMIWCFMLYMCNNTLNNIITSFWTKYIDICHEYLFLWVVFNIFSLLKERILRPLVNLDHLAAPTHWLTQFWPGPLSDCCDIFF